MPNLCDYEIRVRGKKEKVEEFIKVIQSDYNVDKNTSEFDRHLYRVFDADVYDKKEENGLTTAYIAGTCAWSVHSCMMEGSYTYYNEYSKLETHGTSLIQESKNLHLEIEVGSEESGCTFSEHFLINNGDMVIEECNDFYEIYWDGTPESLKEINEAHDLNLTEKDFDENDYYKIGGLDTIDFVID